MYKYPAVPVNKPMAMELRVSSSLMRVSVVSEDRVSRLTIEQSAAFASSNETYRPASAGPECIPCDAHVHQRVSIQLIQNSSDDREHRSEARQEGERRRQNIGPWRSDPA